MSPTTPTRSSRSSSSAASQRSRRSSGPSSMTAIATPSPRSVGGTGISRGSPRNSTRPSLGGGGLLGADVGRHDLVQRGPGGEEGAVGQGEHDRHAADDRTGERGERERLAPAEAAASDVVAERGEGGGGGEGQPERDRREQHADVGQPEREDVPVLEHRQHPEHDHQAGGAGRPRQPPRPGDGEGHEHGHVEGQAEHGEAGPADVHRRHLDQSPVRGSGQLDAGERVPGPCRRPRQVEHDGRGRWRRDRGRGTRPTSGPRPRRRATRRPARSSCRRGPVPARGRWRGRSR